MTTNDPLVSTEWLAAHHQRRQRESRRRDLQAAGRAAAAEGRLSRPRIFPGAVFFDVDAVSDHSNPLPHMFPSAEQFGRDVGHLGIGNGDTVVVYDSGGWVAAPAPGGCSCPMATAMSACSMAA